LVFRITHRDNLPWVLDHGLHCARSGVQDPGFVGIGNADLISRRREHPLPQPCHGTLGDYVPFYFTPYSPMLNNIRTGWGGVTRRERDEIVFLVTSLLRMVELGIDFVFSDRHAYLATARFSNALADLGDWIPWQQLQARDFKKDPNDPGKFERYQAERWCFSRCRYRHFLVSFATGKQARPRFVASLPIAASTFRCTSDRTGISDDPLHHRQLA
jgi:hypothetical protein